jgi:hypothetical protein
VEKPEFFDMFHTLLLDYERNPVLRAILRSYSIRDLRSPTLSVNAYYPAKARAYLTAMKELEEEFISSFKVTPIPDLEMEETDSSSDSPVLRRKVKKSIRSSETHQTRSHAHLTTRAPLLHGQQNWQYPVRRIHSRRQLDIQRDWNRAIETNDPSLLEAAMEDMERNPNFLKRVGRQYYDYRGRDLQVILDRLRTDKPTLKLSIQGHPQARNQAASTPADVRVQSQSPPMASESKSVEDLAVDKANSPKLPEDRDPHKNAVKWDDEVPDEMPDEMSGE